MTIPATTRVALTDFLLERIAEDEVAARVVKQQHGGRKWTFVVDRYGEGWVSYDDGYPLLVTMEAVGESARILVNHVADWNPDRVLAECAVKRRVVGMFQVAQVIQECKSYPGEESAVRLMVDALEGVVRVHATVYADHPDYQTNWRPTP